MWEPPTPQQLGNPSRHRHQNQMANDPPLLNGFELTCHMTDLCRQPSEVGTDVEFPTFDGARFLVFDLARGIPLDQVALLNTATTTSVPCDWIRQMMAKHRLVDSGGNCRICGVHLVNVGQPVLGAVGESPKELCEEAARAIVHLTKERHDGQDPAHSCSRCGALDYRILRATSVMSACKQQKAVLLMAQQCWPVGIQQGAHTYNDLAPRDRVRGTTLCVMCNGNTLVQSRATNTRVQHSSDATTMTMTIGPADGNPSCEWCGMMGSPSKPLKRCVRCPGALYCDKTCQLAAWPTHKLRCLAAPGDKAGSSKD